MGRPDQRPAHLGGIIEVAKRAREYEVIDNHEAVMITGELLEAACLFIVAEGTSGNEGKTDFRTYLSQMNPTVLEKLERSKKAKEVLESLEISTKHLRAVMGLLKRRKNEALTELNRGTIREKLAGIPLIGSIIAGGRENEAKKEETEKKETIKKNYVGVTAILQNHFPEAVRALKSLLTSVAAGEAEGVTKQ